MDKIKCKNCGAEIEITEALSHEFEEDLTRKLNERHKIEVAEAVKSAEEILDHTQSVRVVGIDEAHFFSNGLAAVVLKLVRSGKQVIVAGLNLDFQEKPFPSMPELLALADEIVLVYALCTACNERVATRSQRLIPGDEQYVVGDAEYAARCLSCFIPSE